MHNIDLFYSMTTSIPNSFWQAVKLLVPFYN